MNSKLVKRLLEVRPVYTVFSKEFHNEDIFKCYSEEPLDFADKYKPLTDGDYDRFISSRSAKRQSGLTRQITTLAYKVGKQMLSLAEGMPNERVFPFQRLQLELRAGGGFVLEGGQLDAALQYVPSQGLPALLTALREFQSALHRPPVLPSPRDVLATHGAQHGLYMCCELLVEDGDPVICAQYAYTGLHSVLKPYDAEIIGIPEDANGMIPEVLERVLGDRLAQGLKMPKMLYCVPTGNNPTGSLLPEARRRSLYELACRYDFLIVEDEPYMFLNYTDRPIASFLSLDVAGRVLRLDSVSKVVSAGLRGGWASAPAPLLRRMELHAEAGVLHACTLSQAILLQLLASPAALATHLRSARDLYRARRDALQLALKEAGLEEVSEWTVPDAGLFLWMTVRGVHDVYNMVFKTAFERGLMLIPGQAFLPSARSPSPHLRLTFSRLPPHSLPEAARLLREVIRDEQRLELQRGQQSVAT